MLFPFSQIWGLVYPKLNFILIRVFIYEDYICKMMIWFLSCCLVFVTTIAATLFNILPCVLCYFIFLLHVHSDTLKVIFSFSALVPI